MFARMWKSFAALLVVFACAAPALAVAPSTGDVSLAIDAVGLRGEVTYQIDEKRPHFLWLREDIAIDHIELDQRVLPLPTPTSVAERDATQKWSLPTGAQSGKLKIRFHGGGRPGLNHYVSSDFVFTDAGTTAWFPILDGVRRPYRIAVTTLRGQQARVSGVLARRSETADATTTEFVVDYPSFPALAVGHFASSTDARVGRVALGVDLIKSRDVREALARLSELMRIEQRAFGEYPFRSFRLIEIPAEAGILANLTAGSYEGMFVIRSDYLDLRGFSLGMLGHEMAHQWWGNAVTLEGEGGDYLLDEALAQYAAFDAIEAVEGIASASCFRAGYDAARLGGLRQAAFALASSPPQPLNALPHSPASYESAQNLGALTWSLAAQLLGKEKFNAGLRRLAKQYRFRSVPFDRALEVIAGRQSHQAEMLKKMFSADHLPVGGLSWRQRDGTVEIDFKTQDRTDAPPATVILTTGAARRVQLTPSAGGFHASLREATTVRTVLIDPETRTTWIPQALWNEAVALAPVTIMLRDWNYGEGARARAAAEQLAAGRYGDDPFAIRFRSTLVLAEMIEEEGKPSEAVALYRRALAEATRAPEQLASAWRKLERAAHAAGLEAEAAAAGREAAAARAKDAAQLAQCETMQRLWNTTVQ